MHFQGTVEPVTTQNVIPESNPKCNNAKCNSIFSCLYSMLGGEEHSICDVAFYLDVDFDYLSADI